MTALSVNRINKYFGDRCLFEAGSFDVGEHDRVGLIGDNGSGKTTLFRILIGEETADSGDILFSKNTRVGYLAQHTLQDENITVWEAVERVFAPVIALSKQLQEINEKLESVTHAPAEWLEEQQRLRETFEASGGLYYKSRIASTLTGLGFEKEAFSQRVSTLSGGQRAKVSIGCLLLSDANLLLLDEPTNHLDIAAVEWLEGFLRSYTGAVIVISHDRYFLDRVTTRTVEISNQAFYATNGNYSAHKEKRETDKEIAAKHQKIAERKIKKLEENIALLKQWNREKSVRAAESREKRLERMKAEQIVLEKESQTLRFGFSAATTGGTDVIDAGQLSMSFAQPLFKDVSFKLRRGERVFLLGPNGCGKTTLLRILKGQIEPQSGYVNFGSKISLGYYDQLQSELSYDKAAIDQLWDEYPALTQTELRSALATFLFYGDEVFKPIHQLSGGEKARLLLLKLMLAHDNLLLLDEPTNHLDIASREALEAALENYDGTLFVVSHDRYFINRLSTRILQLNLDGCTSFDGNYDDYQAKMLPQQMKTVAEKPVKENEYKLRKEQESQKRKLATRIRRLEEEISRIESNIAELSNLLEQPEVAADYEKVVELSSTLEEQNKHLETLFAEWESAQAEFEAM